MYIADQNYQTDLTMINKFRYSLFIHFYNNPTYIDALTKIIARHIDALYVDYDSIRYVFTIKIKKTSMRRIHGFTHNPNFYYPIIIAIFTDFIKEYISDAYRSIGHQEGEDVSILEKLFENPSLMANLCHISCISDNIIRIQL